MPRHPTTPKYCLHRATGNAYVRLGGEWITLGPHGSPESRVAYDRVVAGWLANGRRRLRLRDKEDDTTITELIAAFWQHAKSYYRKPDGSPTSEVGNFRQALRLLRRVYGDTTARLFGPLQLKAIRELMIERGSSRKYTNTQIDRIKHTFKWAVSEQIVPVTTYDALKTVSGLRRGLTSARESDPVRPVPDEHVDAVEPLVNRQVWAAIQLQRLTGMRAGEVLAMRGRDLDMSDSIWLYAPDHHKTAHHGHGRVVQLGPKAQELLGPFLGPSLDAYLFSPRDAENERLKRRHLERQTPLSCGNRPGTNRKSKPKRSPRDHYDTCSYRRAIHRACDVAEVPRWSPHQLRHSYATRIRRDHGLEMARVLLGHRSAVTSEWYAELDRGKALEVVAKTG